MFCDPVYILPMREVKRRRLNLASTKPPDHRRVRLASVCIVIKWMRKGHQYSWSMSKTILSGRGWQRGLCVRVLCPLYLPLMDKHT